MRCIICGLDTGDACVPLCALHMPLAEMAGLVELGEISDWPDGSGPEGDRVSHIKMMCDKMHPCA